MRISAGSVLADEKLTHYLLIQRPFDDKSRFLALAGFTLYNWMVLREAILALTHSVDANKNGGNEYGEFFEVRGKLAGPLGVIKVKLVWMRRAVDGTFHFVTLVPWKE